MLKRIILFLILAALLAACGQAPAPAGTPAASAPAATTGSEGAATAPAAPGCTVVSVEPTAGPTEASVFPAPSADDWIQGPETAYVTITEYSDFQ